MHFMISAALAFAVQREAVPARMASQEMESQRIAAVRAHYVKHEFRIPMRDGRKLFTAVFAPRDTRRTYPFLLMRTPYSIRPYGAENYPDGLRPSIFFEKSGYIFVYQDVRGRWMSEGDFVHMRPQRSDKKLTDIDESTDTYDTIDWLLKHVAGHNGRVGLWGVSYPGFYAAAGMIDAHPALKAVSPQAPQADWFMGDDWHHNGALLGLNMFNFMAVIDRPHPGPTSEPNPPVFRHDNADGYDFCLHMGPLRAIGRHYLKDESAFWNEAIEHDTYDAYWRARNLRPHLRNIKPAVMTVGGWFDGENLFGALEVYKSVKRQSPGTSNRLVMGPWFHGGWILDEGSKLGDIQFHSNSAEFYREHIELPFFECYLKNNGKLKQAGAWAFQTGVNRWREHDTWPPPAAAPQAFYFQAGGKLGYRVPSDTSEGLGYDRYISDPAKPVPFEEKITNHKSAEYMSADQRFAARRPDVLVFATDRLDSDVSIAGPIQADLFISTTGSDADFIVKVIDVYPNDFPDRTAAGVRMGGYQQLVRGDVMPGRFRNNFEKPEALVPGRPAEIKFALPDAYHTFRRGHRIMVQVQSTWYPLIDRNPQTFLDKSRAQASEYRKAEQQVHRTRDLPSHVTMLVMP
jgi:uncharacterized protein